MTISILYVDDEPDFLKICTRFLEKEEDMRVHGMTNAEDALKELASGGYDVIISDYLMPGIDGIRFLKEVRSHYGNIPFLLFTGRGREEVVIEALNSGADFYVQKGGDPLAQFTELIYKIRQIVHQRQAERLLVESERRFRKTLETMNLVAFQLAEDGTILFCNDALLTLLGWKREEFEGKNFFDLAVPKDRREKKQELYKEAISKGTISQHEEIKVLLRSGEIRTLDIFNTDLRDENGVITSYICIGEDITEKNRIQGEIARWKEQYEDLLTQSRQCAYECDPVSGMVHYNRSLIHVLGYAPEEMDGLVDIWMRIIHPEDIDMVREVIYTARKGEVPVIAVYRVMHKDGSYIWISDRSFVRNKPDGTPSIIGTISDINAQKEVQEALIESEERYRQIFSRANDAFLLYEVLPDGRPGSYIDLNEKATELTGYSQEDLYMMNLSDIRQPVLPETEKSIAFRLITDGEVRYEGIIHNRSGEQIPVQISSYIFTLKSKKVAISIIRDISLEKQLEEEIRLSEEKFRTLFCSGYDMIMVHELERDGSQGRFIEVNNHACETLGYSREEFLTLRPYDIVTAEHIQNEMPEVFKSLELCGNAQVRAMIVGRDGRKIPSEISLHRFILQGRPVCISIVRDITEQLEYQQKLESATKKLSLIGSITRHDISNSLTGLYGYLVLMQETENPDEKNSFFLNMTGIIEAIREQITFAREYEQVGITSPVWHNISSSLSRLPWNEITLTESLPSGLEIYADPMLDRVFYNLLDNSRSHGKSVTSINVSFTPADDPPVLVWEDNGAGIPTDLKPLIFDAGFGKNTGYGLYLIREILSITGMTIQETGTEGEGARFEIRLPSGKFRYDSGSSKLS